MALPVFSYLRGIIAICFLAGNLIAPFASAITPEEKAGARAAAQEGAEAYQAGNYQKAVDYFTRAESIIHAPPHLLYIARAELKMGHLVAAREAYMKIIHEELSNNAPKVFREAKDDAEGELEELEPRLPHVSVLVQDAGEQEVTVSRDGVDLPPALVGIPVPTDPGTHTFRAKARGLASAPKNVTVAEGETAKVVLKLLPTGEPLEEDSEAEDTPEGVVPPSSPEEGGTSAATIVGFTTLGLGIVGAGVGTGLLIYAADIQNPANQLFSACDAAPGGCTDAQRAEIDRIDNEAHPPRIAGYVSIGVGSALVITGVTLLIVGGKSKKEHGLGPRVWPVVGLSSLGLAGTF